MRVSWKDSRSASRLSRSWNRCTSLHYTNSIIHTTRIRNATAASLRAQQTTQRLRCQFSEALTSPSSNNAKTQPCQSHARSLLLGSRIPASPGLFRCWCRQTFDIQSHCSSLPTELTTLNKSGDTVIYPSSLPTYTAWLLQHKPLPSPQASKCTDLPLHTNNLLHPPGIEFHAHTHSQQPHSPRPSQANHTKWRSPSHAPPPHTASTLRAPTDARTPTSNTSPSRPSPRATRSIPPTTTRITTPARRACTRARALAILRGCRVLVGFWGVITVVGVARIRLRWRGVGRIVGRG